MQIGEVYRVKSNNIAFPEAKGKTRLLGTVVYVHPDERHATLLIQCEYGSFRESFFSEQLKDKVRRCSRR